jgi:hypothetical protein
MAIEYLVEEIKKLNTQQKKELFDKLGVVPQKEKLRGGQDDPLSELIGMFNGSSTGSRNYKEDLYGGKKPL